MAPTYFDELPKTTIEIKKVQGLEVKPRKYYYDFQKRQIIRRCNLKFDPKPFAIIQGPKFQPVLISRDKPSKRFDLLMLINSFARKYEERIRKSG